MGLWSLPLRIVVVGVTSSSIRVQSHVVGIVLVKVLFRHDEPAEYTLQFIKDLPLVHRIKLCAAARPSPVMRTMARKMLGVIKDCWQSIVDPNVLPLQTQAMHALLPRPLSACPITYWCQDELMDSGLESSMPILSSETAAHAGDKRRTLGALGWRAIRMLPHCSAIKQEDWTCPIAALSSKETG